MVTEGIDQAVEQESAIDEGQKTDGPAELRAALNREKERNAALRNELIATRLADIGLDVEAGLGKAIAKEYEGDLTVEALSEYARSEYKYEGGVESTPPEVATGERLEQLQSVGEPVTPPPPVDQAAEITAKMNDPEAGREEAASSIAAKASQFYQEHYGTET